VLTTQSFHNTRTSLVTVGSQALNLGSSAFLLKRRVLTLPLPGSGALKQHSAHCRLRLYTIHFLSASQHAALIALKEYATIYVGCAHKALHADRTTPGGVWWFCYFMRLMTMTALHQPQRAAAGTVHAQISNITTMHAGSRPVGSVHGHVQCCLFIKQGWSRVLCWRQHWH
jgi:hypothetical protein